MEFKLVDCLLIICLVSCLFVVGYKTGTWHEQKEWKQRLPDSMDGLCTECERVGEDMQRDFCETAKDLQSD